METLFEIAFLWCPDGDSWVRNAFSIHLIHLSATEKNLSVGWLSCLDQLFELQLRNYINESCHSFMLFSIAPNPININKSNNSHGKLAWMPQMQQKPKSNTKHWATDLWASGSSFVIPFRMPHELQTKKSRGKW